MITFISNNMLKNQVRHKTHKIKATNLIFKTKQTSYKLTENILLHIKHQNTQDILELVLALVSFCVFIFHFISILAVVYNFPF